MATVRRWLAAMMATDKNDKITDKNDRNDQTPDLQGPIGVREGPGPELSEQQRAAVDRGTGVIRRFGGVLLADAVGLGKTRVAVAMARRVVADVRRRSGPVQPVLLAVPARLRQNWRRAIGAVGWQLERDARIISHHKLSRQPFEGRPPVVVVDEAHRFRNPAAKRSRHLARLTARSPPILVTATPVCTSERDLLELLRYFLSDPIVKSMVGMGLEAAFEADEAGQFDVVEILEEVVIRRRSPDFGVSGRPAVRFEILRYRAGDDERWMWKNLETTLQNLHLAAIGDHWPRGLLVNNLMRMWESGPASLAESLEEILHFHQRWLDAADSGRAVERPDFREVFGGVDRRQEVFSFAYGTVQKDGPDEARRRKVVEDCRAISALYRRVDALRTKPSAMLEAIGELVGRRRGQKFLIFAAYRAAAESIFESLASLSARMRVGLVTGDTARATGLGATTAREVMDRFYADDKSPRAPHERLRILVATDCLSEGVNLDGCSNLILADLPYSPVKLEQRIGRIARPGSDIEEVTVYLCRPQSWTDSLGMRGRLSGRLNTASRLGMGNTLIDARDLSADNDQCSVSETTGGSGPPDPLAAMTLAQRLRSRLKEVEDADVPAFARRVDKSTGEPESLWVRVRFQGVGTRYGWLWLSAGDEPPIARLSAQISGLGELADDRRNISTWTPGGRLWKRAEAWLEKRRTKLEAARLAPPLLGAGSEPTKMWRRLQEAIQRQSEDTDGDRLQSWRHRLLQPHPPGIRWEMEQLMGRDPSVSVLVQFVEGLQPPAPGGPVKIDAVGALAM